MLTFSSGLCANLGVLTALVDSNDDVVCDELVHATLIDGCRLSGARIVRFGHHDMGALCGCLERSATAGRGALVIVDGVYSVGGDICKLDEVGALCDRFGVSRQLRPIAMVSSEPSG